MNDPKDIKRKKEEDTDFSDELGGGTDDVFTKKEFMKALDKVIERKISPDEGKSKTSE